MPLNIITPETPVVLSKSYLKRLEVFEGRANYFYLDTEGFVTIGIGCMIPVASMAINLQLFLNSTNVAANVQTKLDDYNAVKNAPKGLSLAAYKKYTKCYMDEKEVVRLFNFRVREKYEQLTRSNFWVKDLPTPAIEVMFDMAFNMGVSGLMGKFSKFMKAMQARDFKTAAEESKRRQIQDSRNDWARETLEAL